MQLEASKENRTAAEMERLNRTVEEMEKERREHISLLWEITLNKNVLSRYIWMAEADNILKNYTTVVYRYTKMMGWDLEIAVWDAENEWSFAGSVLYAITVITTTGTRRISLLVNTHGDTSGQNYGRTLLTTNIKSRIRVFD